MHSWPKKQSDLSAGAEFAPAAEFHSRHAMQPEQFAVPVAGSECVVQEKKFKQTQVARGTEIAFTPTNTPKMGMRNGKRTINAPF